jgi:membrane protein EpsK
MNETTQKFKKQLPKNMVMAVLSFMTYALTAVWLTPYLIQHLGSAAYGLIPLAGLLTQYAGIITGQISGATTRFLTIELQKTGGNPNVIFNSAFALYLLLIAIQLPAFGAAIYFADRLFSIPPAIQTDFLILLACSGACFLINLMGSVFGTSLYANNRLDIGFLIGTIVQILKLILILVLFLVFGPRLRYLGYIELLLQLVTFGVSIVLWRKITPELSIRIKDVNWRMLGPMFHMSFWGLISHFGALLYLRTDIWLINRFISAAAAGQYAAVLVVGNFIRKIADMGNAQLGPVIMNYWAKGELLELHRLLLISVKIFVFCIAILVSLICANGRGLLSLWLGEEYADFASLLSVLTIHLCINTAVYPLFKLFPASNSVRMPAIVTIVMGVMNVIVSYVLGVTMGMGAIGVALATAVVLTLKNAFFTPLYCAAILKQPYWVYLDPLLRSVPLMGLFYLLSLIPVAAWLGLDVLTVSGILVQSTVVGCCAVALGWYVIFARSERSEMFNLFKRKIEDSKRKVFGGAGT